MNDNELKDFLDFKVGQYQTADFIAEDPVSIPHRYRRNDDIEIAGLLAATISWGNRKAILKSANTMMDFLDNAPADFVAHASDAEIAALSRFVYRTFQADDLCGMVRGLRDIYANHGGLEAVFTPAEGETVKDRLSLFRRLMLPHLSERTHKHIANVDSGASAKRLNMFLRWMVRPATTKVDFGLWKGIDTAQLMLPLDVHTGNVGRSFCLLKRKQNDWKSVEEITAALRRFDPVDPVKYDFALFGLGIYEKWK